MIDQGAPGEREVAPPPTFADHLDFHQLLCINAGRARARVHCSLFSSPSRGARRETRGAEDSEPNERHTTRVRMPHRDLEASRLGLHRDRRGGVVRQREGVSVRPAAIADARTVVPEVAPRN